MSFEEEFDSIMRGKSEELDYPFDEKNWDKAGALLDAERNVAGPAKNRFLLPLLISAGLLITGGAVLIANWSPAKQTAALKTGIATPAEQTENISPAADKTTHAAAIAQVHAEHTEAVASPSQPLSSVTDGKSATTPAAPVAQLAAAPENIKTAITAAHPVPVTKAIHNLAVSAMPSKENEVKDEARNQAAASPVIEAKHPEAAPNEQENARNTSSTNENTTNAALAVAPTKQVSDQEQSASSVPASENETTAYFVEQLPLLPVAFPEQAEPEIGTPLNYMNRYDDDYFKSNKRTKTHFFNVELGGTYLLGWNTQAGKDGKGLDWFGGVNYGVYFTRKISMSIGLQAYDIKNITQAFYTSKKVEYEFGSITSNTVITSNNLYYVAVPVKFNYAINRSNQIGLGANFGYLADSRNKVETFQVQDGSMIHYKPVRNTGVYQGANSMNILLGVSYRTELIPRLYLNTELVYGISDIFKNNKSNSNDEQAMGLRLSLQYTLFDK